MRAGNGGGEGMSEFIDPLNDPRFPDRPTHEDFWRMSEVCLAHDAEATESGGGLMAIVDRIVDEKSLMYLMKNRLATAFGTEPTPQMMALYLDAFCLGADYQQRGGHRA